MGSYSWAHIKGRRISRKKDHFSGRDQKGKDLPYLGGFESISFIKDFFVLENHGIKYGHTSVPLDKEK